MKQGTNKNSNAMETIFVKNRSELTGQMKKATANGRTCYRVRSVCNCKPHLKNPEMYPYSNMRNGVLVIDGNTVVSLFIRCKVCSIPPKNG